jgi:hypothetical protein
MLPHSLTLLAVVWLALPVSHARAQERLELDMHELQLPTNLAPRTGPYAKASHDQARVSPISLPKRAWLSIAAGVGTGVGAAGIYHVGRAIAQSGDIGACTEQQTRSGISVIGVGGSLALTGGLILRNRRGPQPWPPARRIVGGVGAGTFVVSMAMLWMGSIVRSLPDCRV